MTEIEERIEEANRETAERIVSSKPVLVDVKPAIEVIPGMKEDFFLHSGPPIEWEDMPGPVRAAVTGAMVYEGMGESIEEAAKKASRRDVTFGCTHDHLSVAPVAGIVTPHMPVYVVKNETYGNYAFSPINEGVGKTKTLRFGSNAPEVIERLRWMEKVLGPALSIAIRKLGGIDLRDIIAESLRRGDECHNRNKAATASVFQKLAPPLIRSDLDRETVASILDFINGNVHFFLNLSMASSKATMDAAHHVKYSTVVAVMTINGVEFGMRVGGLGDQWFTAPAPRQTMGKFFDGYTEEDAAAPAGDSCISEPAGIGGFAMAASPAIAEFVGGSPSFGVEVTNRMYEIAVTEHKYYKIPFLDYKGTPTGIDIVKVVRKGIVPVFNLGVAHKEPGIGQIGAGIGQAPMECFKKAVVAFEKKYEITII